MRLTLATLGLLAAGTIPPSPPPVVTGIEYQLTFTKTTAATRSLGVSMRFQASAAGPVELSLPAWTPGAYEISNYARRVSSFTATSGTAALRWLWPSLAFLLFMFPLPYKIESTLGWPLQKVAAVGSEFVLQTIGYPTFREGVTLHCKDHLLEVQNACNGLSMLLTFFTLSAGMAIVIRRPWVDKLIIVLSAVPIAILSNVVRISRVLLAIRSVMVAVRI